MSKTQKSTQNVFLSYDTADQAIVDKIRAWLESRTDVKVFDPRSLSPGENWQARLLRELNKMDVYVVVLSPESYNSPYVLQEFGAAWAKRKRIVPVLTQANVRMPVAIQGVRAIVLGDLEKPETLSQFFEDLQEAV